MVSAGRILVALAVVGPLVGACSIDETDPGPQSATSPAATPSAATSPAPTSTAAASATPEPEVSVPDWRRNSIAVTGSGWARSGSGRAATRRTTSRSAAARRPRRARSGTRSPGC